MTNKAYAVIFLEANMMFRQAAKPDLIVKKCFSPQYSYIMY